MQSGKIQDVAKFIRAGRAVFTIRSKRTGQRYTYKVVRKDDYDMWHVRVLSGPDNTSDYNYIGFIGRDGMRFVPKRGAKITPSGAAFRWFLENVESDKVEVWHEGRCGRCGRALTVPSSIESGFGSKCREAMGC